MRGHGPVGQAILDPEDRNAYGRPRKSGVDSRLGRHLPGRPAYDLSQILHHPLLAGALLPALLLVEAVVVCVLSVVAHWNIQDRLIKIAFGAVRP